MSLAGATNPLSPAGSSSTKPSSGTPRRVLKHGAVPVPVTSAVTLRARDLVTGLPVPDAVLTVGFRVNPHDAHFLSVQTQQADARGEIVASWIGAPGQGYYRLVAPGYARQVLSTETARRVHRSTSAFDSLDASADDAWTPEPSSPGLGRSSGSSSAFERLPITRDLGDVLLRPHGCIVSGRVVDAVTDEPLALGFAARFEKADAHVDATIAPKSMFRACLPSPGRYTLTVTGTSSGMEDASVAVTLTQGTRELEIPAVRATRHLVTTQLTPVEVVGHLPDASSAHFPPHSTMSVEGRHFAAEAFSIADSGGITSVRLHPHDRAVVTFCVPGCEPLTFRHMKPAQVVPLSLAKLRIADAPGLRVTVLDARYGTIVSGASVSAEPVSTASDARPPHRHKPRTVLAVRRGVGYELYLSASVAHRWRLLARAPSSEGFEPDAVAQEWSHPAALGDAAATPEPVTLSVPKVPGLVEGTTSLVNRRNGQPVAKKTMTTKKGAAAVEFDGFVTFTNLASVADGEEHKTPCELLPDGTFSCELYPGRYTVTPDAAWHVLPDGAPAVEVTVPPHVVSRARKPVAVTLQLAPPTDEVSSEDDAPAPAAPASKTEPPPPPPKPAPPPTAPAKKAEKAPPAKKTEPAPPPAKKAEPKKEAPLLRNSGSQ